MLKIDEFRISNDGKHIIMTVSVRTESYYENVYIEYLALYTEDTWNKKVSEGGGPVWESQNYGNVKTLSLTIDADDILAYAGDKVVIKDHLFILQAWADGAPTPDVPCGMDTNPVLAVTIPTLQIYANLMLYLKSLGDTCEIPKDLIDQILKYKVFDMVIKQGDVDTAILYYKKWYTEELYKGFSSKCGCHG